MPVKRYTDDIDVASIEGDIKDALDGKPVSNDEAAEEDDEEADDDQETDHTEDEI